jgi:hypothetical protein
MNGTPPMHQARVPAEIMPWWKLRKNNILNQFS